MIQRNPVLVNKKCVECILTNLCVERMFIIFVAGIFSFLELTKTKIEYIKSNKLNLETLASNVGFEYASRGEIGHPAVPEPLENILCFIYM